MQISLDKIFHSASQRRFRLRDNGGRRLGAELRVYSYSSHIPERRNGMDRRCGIDRRKTPRIKFKKFMNSSNSKYDS